MDSLVHLDGGWATALVSRGELSPGTSLESLLDSRPEVLTRLGEQYAAAGAELLLTPTFRTGVDWPIPATVDAAIAALAPIGVELVGCVGPASTFSRQWSPEVPSHFRPLAECFESRGIRTLVLQTFARVREAEEAVRQARSAFAGTLVASLTPAPNGRLWDDTAPSEALCRLADLGADVVGFNCGTTPRDIAEVVEAVPHDRLWLQLPGGPDFLDWAVRLAPRAAYLGGCCGTEPRHIRELTGRLSAPR